MPAERESMLSGRPLPWREILDTLLRRRRLIFLGGAVGLAAGLVLAAISPPLYRVQANVQLTAAAVPGPREAAMSDEQIQAELALMKSPVLIRGVLEETRSGEGKGKSAGRAPFGAAVHGFGSSVQAIWASLRGAEPPDLLDLRIQKIAEEIRAAPVGRSNLVEISYVDTDPAWAATFVNRLLRRHVERIADLNQRGSARPLYEQERRQALARWQQASKALADYRAEQGADLLAGDESQLGNVLATLQSQRVAAETEVLELRARSDFLSRKLENLPRTIDAEWTVTEDESVRLLKQRILELEIERSEALSRFTPQSTIVKDLDRQIAEAQRLFATKQGETLSETTTTVDPSYQALQVDLMQTEAQLTAATARARALSEQVDIYRDRQGRLETAAGELERLEEAVTNARDLYRRYSDQEEQARVTAVLGESGFVNVSVVDEAVVPSTPLPSGAGKMIRLSTLAGLLLGTLLAFLFDALDPTVKNGAQAARLTGVAVIAEIPNR